MRPIALISVLVGLLLTGRAHAEVEVSDAESSAPAEPQRAHRESLFFPAGKLYPPYIADPHLPAAAILVQTFTSTEIDGAGDQRFFLKLGGQFGLVRWERRAPGGRAWQLNLDVGFDAQFDIDNSLDNTGWDGNYGLSLTTAKQGGRVACKLGTFHTSAHLGDEWIERTGLERLGYTRQEVLVGLSWSFAARWRTYLEAGWGWDLHSEEMEPGRLQAGLDFRAPGRFWAGVGGWYAAVDLSSWEERDWRLDVGFQGGLLMASTGRVWRLGIQYWNGRVPLGEFFQHTESSLAFGLWSEL